MLYRIVIASFLLISSSSFAMTFEQLQNQKENFYVSLTLSEWASLRLSLMGTIDELKKLRKNEGDQYELGKVIMFNERLLDKLTNSAFNKRP